MANGAYTLTPTKNGLTFNPPTQSVTVSGASLANVNFTATAQVAPTFSISGTITLQAGGSGATVVLTGKTAASTTADALAGLLTRAFLSWDSKQKFTP